MQLIKHTCQDIKQYYVKMVKWKKTSSVFQLESYTVSQFPGKKTAFVS